MFSDNDGVIGISMLVVAAIYEKYKNGELYTEVVISENTLPYLEQVRHYQFHHASVINQSAVPINYHLAE